MRSSAFPLDRLFRSVRVALSAPLLFFAATPASADPWTAACERFYELAHLSRPAVQRHANAAALDEHLRRGEAIGFSGAATVQQGRRVLLDRGYGFADWRQGAAMTPDTVFDIGSVSKQFTAAAILRLQEQGRLDVHDTLSRFFANVPADKAGITIDQLLTHSAGFTSEVAESRLATTRDAMVAAILSAPLTAGPGEHYAYSNAGYALLGAIVEIASGEGYESFLRRELWLPAGMRRTGWTLFDRREVRFAQGYNASGAVPTPDPAFWTANGPAWFRRGPGSILSTVDDLRRWANALRHRRIFGEQTLSMLITPRVHEDGESPSYYGYGWAISAGPDGACRISHDGTNNVHYNVLAIYPERDLISEVAILQAFSPLTQAVIRPAPRVLLGAQPSALPSRGRISAATARRLAGWWRAPDGTEVHIIARGSRLIVPVNQSGAARLFTPFAPIPAGVEARIRAARAQLPDILDGLARGNYGPLLANLSSASTPGEERNYWAGKWAEWTHDHGAYRGNELIGTSSRAGNWVTWILLRFEQANIVAAANYDRDGHVLIGNDIFVAPDTEVFPSEYVLAPSADGIMRTYNGSFAGAVEVRFDSNERRMLIHGPRGETELIRIGRPLERSAGPVPPR